MRRLRGDPGSHFFSFAFAFVGWTVLATNVHVVMIET